MYIYLRLEETEAFPAIPVECPVGKKAIPY
jgi:hypothetical protein